MMTQFALASGLSWNERISTSVTVTLQGMLTIFCVLALLWGTIELMHCLMPKKKGEKVREKTEKPAKEKKPKEKPATQKKAESTAATPNEQDAAIAAAIAASMAAYEDGGATVAAIIAAISAERAEEGETGGFRVVSFKRAETRKRRKGF